MCMDWNGFTSHWRSVGSKTVPVHAQLSGHTKPFAEITPSNNSLRITCFLIVVFTHQNTLQWFFFAIHYLCALHFFDHNIVYSYALNMANLLI